MSETECTTYMTDKVGPLPFCPGCGHHLVIKALDKAMVKLQLDPQNVVIVTDIGCIGLSDRYFTTNAFHGLHGRSITYACGLKLARPELTVIALKGDGGCGIGGTHLLNVARRNIGITVLVVGSSADYVSKFARCQGEYHALVLLAAGGLMLMASTGELISIYVSLELASISLYALVAFLKDKKSSEAGLKYLILGAIS